MPFETACKRISKFRTLRISFKKYNRCAILIYKNIDTPVLTYFSAGKKKKFDNLENLLGYYIINLPEIKENVNALTVTEYLASE